METRIYPFETDHLRKGDRVTREQIERAYGVKAGTDEYRLRGMLRAREHVLSAFAERGEIVTVTEERQDLVILTDEEAAAYNERHFDLALDSMRRCHGRKLAVDRAELSAEVRERHDRTLLTQGRQLHAVRVAAKLEAAPRERETPAALAAALVAAVGNK
jgi:hypothetical protein